MKFKGLIYIVILMMLVSCEPNLKEDFNYTEGSADFTTYVAIGNSLTAGYADAALYTSGQQNSFPNILAGQLKLVGGGDFKQPLIETENGVGLSEKNGNLYLTTKYILALVEEKNCDGSGTGKYSLKPANIDPNPDQAQQLQYLMSPPPQAGPYNNVGVPGAMIQHLLFDKYGDPTAFDPSTGQPLSNPYFVRFASSTNTTVIADALANNPSFFSLWIGNNDVLTSALAGTDALVTPPEVFGGAYDLILQSMFSTNADIEGVLANIPDITSIPFFNTISAALPYNGLVLSAENAAKLTQIYAAYGHTEITFQEGPNAFVVMNEDGSMGRTEEGDLFLLSLPTQEIVCSGLGSVDLSDTTLNPMPGAYILNNNEQANIKAAIEAYNTTIANLAAQYDIPLVDVHSILKDFETGMTFDGLTYTTTFIEGGLFSLDGVHLNAQGNALLTNYFIEAINAKYGANIPEVIVSDYEGIIFP